MADFDYEFEREWSEPKPTLALKPVRTIAPAAEVVTLAQFKSHCRVDHDDDNGDLQSYLDTAIEALDGYSGIIGRALINQTWRVDRPSFCNVMRLPLEPLVSITSITYYDGDNVQQTLSTSVYGAYTDARGPFVGLKSGQAWPTVFERADAVSITFVCGFGAAATDVPARLRAAIRLHGAHLYKYRAMDAPSDYKETGTYIALIKPFNRTY